MQSGGESAAEDQLSRDPCWLDFKSIEKGEAPNQKSQSLNGAATISQQGPRTFFSAGGQELDTQGAAGSLYFSFP